MVVQRPSTVRSPALRSNAFSLANAFSIGLKSGEQGGSSYSRAPVAWIAARTPATLWSGRLSITTI